MSRVLALLSLAALTLTLTAEPARAQSLRQRADTPRRSSRPADPWTGSVRYSVLTDYADSAQPRGYNQGVRAGLNYQFDQNWAMSGEASVRAETYNGQIDKSREQTYAETLNPSVAAELDYQRRFGGAHSYTLFAHGEPLLDEPSRREGYRGIIGAGASLSLGFFGKRYSMDHILDISELINTFDYAGNLEPNPDMFYTYKFVNSLRFWKTYRFSVSWGVKVTRYLDHFVGYSYSTTISLSKSWRHFALGAAYDNGGFTDDGQVRLWYLDQYRRVAMLMLNYSF
jgi:hypothetical protein